MCREGTVKWFNTTNDLNYTTSIESVTSTFMPRRLTFYCYSKYSYIDLNVAVDNQNDLSYVSEKKNSPYQTKRKNKFEVCSEIKEINTVDITYRKYELEENCIGSSVCCCCFNIWNCVLQRNRFDLYSCCPNSKQDSQQRRDVELSCSVDSWNCENFTDFDLICSCEGFNSDIDSRGFCVSFLARNWFCDLYRRFLDRNFCRKILKPKFCERKHFELAGQPETEVVMSVEVNRTPTLYSSTNYVLSSPRSLITTAANYSNCTNCSNEATEAPVTIWEPDVIQRVATIGVIMVLALVGNAAIILMLTCTRYRKRNSRVNIFIIHLAIGDLAVCICTMTTEILFVAFGEWVLGPALCKILPYTQGITLSSTTFILTSMSFDRYMAICKPLKYRATTARAKTFIAISWIMAFVLAVPQLLIFQQSQVTKKGRVMTLCRTTGYTAPWQRRVYLSFFTAYILVIPVMLISFFYVSIVMVVSKASRVVQTSQNNNHSLRRAGLSGKSKSTFPRAKIRTVWLTFAIIATFVICYTPYFVTTLIRVFSDYKINIPKSVMALVETITFIQSAFNPLIYGCFNVKLKRSLVELFCPYKEHKLRRSPSYRSPGLCMSVSDGRKALHRPQYEMKLCPGARLREPSVNNHSHSSSGNSRDDRLLGRAGSSVTVTEENKNGIRLRVRFVSKDQIKCLSSDRIDSCHSESNMPYNLMEPGQKLTVFRHHSLQQLYK